MFDLKNNRSFLKRTKCEALRLGDLHIGNSVNILSRQLRIIDFGDDWTRRNLQSHTEKTLGIIKPQSVQYLGQIISDIEKAHFFIVNLKMFQLKREQAIELYAPHKGKPFMENLLNLMTSGPVVAFELMRENAVAAWRDMTGPTDPAVGKREAPQSLRAKYGLDPINNAVHGSDSTESAMREINFFFPDNGCSIPNTARFSQSTCAVIKPHLVTNGQLGSIILAIVNAGFEISALRMYNLDKANAEEFLEVYKGVLAEYSAILLELISGPCVAMEICTGIRLKNQIAQKAFREFVGPLDPEMARHLRPNTLRATFGKDKVCNGLHCTDLPEDAELEVQYFFQIMDK